MYPMKYILVDLFSVQWIPVLEPLEAYDKHLWQAPELQQLTGCYVLPASAAIPCVGFVEPLLSCEEFKALV
jgi:hypothetical protein